MSDPIIISANDKTTAEAVGADMVKALTNGINTSAGAEFSPKLDGYDIANNAAVISGIKQNFALMSRYLLPLVASYSAVGPIYNIGAGDAILAYMSVENSIQRNVIINVAITAYTDTVDAYGKYSIYDNDVMSSSEYIYWFNTSSDHRTICATIPMTLDPGSHYLTLRLRRASGAGLIKLDANDIVTLSLVG